MPSDWLLPLTPFSWSVVMVLMITVCDGLVSLGALPFAREVRSRSASMSRRMRIRWAGGTPSVKMPSWNAGEPSIGLENKLRCVRRRSAVDLNGKTTTGEKLRQFGLRVELRRRLVGWQREAVETLVKPLAAECVLQDKQLGTGHAVLCAESAVRGDTVIVLCGDCPMTPPELLHDLLRKHATAKAACTA